MISLDIPEITKEILYSMEINNDESAKKFLYPTPKDLYSYKMINHINEVIELFKYHIAKKSTILFYCDYDVDGICSASILTLGLRKTLKDYGCEFIIKLPTRQEGYGMNLDYLKKITSKKDIGLIITADNGIKCVEEVKYCRDKNIDVIVLDHHTPDIDNLPNANYIIDFYLPDNTYPFKHLCGAGLSFKFICAINNSLNNDINKFYPLLQYVALATIADVVPLVDENRTLTYLGIKDINKRPLFGIKSLLNNLNINKEVDSEVINFQIAPCINAPGRIHVPDLSYNLLINNNHEVVNKLAIEVININKRRKELTEKFTNDAIAQIEKSYINDYVYIIKCENCPEGIIGLVAGRVKEKYNKPAIVFTEHNGYLTGSARSIEKFNIYDNLTLVKDLLLRYGGHALAAGLSIKKENLDILRKEINKIANTILNPKDFEKQYNIFKEINNSDIEQYYNAVTILEPFGEKNPKPLFEVNFKTNLHKFKQVYYEILVEKYLKLYGVNNTVGISFDETIKDKYINLNTPSTIKTIGYLNKNIFNNYTSYQINILDFKGSVLND